MLSFEITRLLVAVGIFVLGVSSFIGPELGRTFQEIYPQLAGRMGYKEVAKAVNVAARPIRDRVLKQGKELYDGLEGCRLLKSNFGQTLTHCQTATQQVNEMEGMQGMQGMEGTQGMQAESTWQRVSSSTEGAPEGAVHSLVMGVMG
ncbi:unnamed protein product [Bemisia tabaci]|uniref:Uncharacterized protein n=1 Tax=Bemisia tabaci TaxID=7038 RepID=A0A9P0A819_BEMTA|nr:unnamed protein product [Bemisia tabaci]